MTITNGVGSLFLEELPLGIHTLFDGAPNDVVKVALYGPNAILTPNLDTYIAGGEVSGGGYVAGGFVMTDGLTIVGRSGSARADGPQFAFPYMQPTIDMDIAVTGIAIRGLMVYNSSQADRNILTLDFGGLFNPSTGLRLKWGLSNVVAEADVLVPLYSSGS